MNNSQSNLFLMVMVFASWLAVHLTWPSWLLFTILTIYTYSMSINAFGALCIKS